MQKCIERGQPARLRRLTLFDTSFAIDQIHPAKRTSLTHDSVGVLDKLDLMEYGLYNALQGIMRH